MDEMCGRMRRINTNNFRVPKFKSGSLCRRMFQLHCACCQWNFSFIPLCIDFVHENMPSEDRITHSNRPKSNQEWNRLHSSTTTEKQLLQHSNCYIRCSVHISTYMLNVWCDHWSLIKQTNGYYINFKHPFIICKFVEKKTNVWMN